MSYKIIALDLDGTLTNSQKVIPPQTHKTLMNFQKNGGKVITITVFEAPGAAIPVFPVSFFVLKLNPAFPLFFIPPFSGIIFVSDIP